MLTYQAKSYLHKTTKEKPNYCKVWWATEWESDREFIRNHVTHAHCKATTGNWLCWKEKAEPKCCWKTP